MYHCHTVDQIGQRLTRFDVPSCRTSAEQSAEEASVVCHPSLLRTTTFTGLHSLDVMWKPLKSIFLIAFLTEYYHDLMGQPRVQLGDTILMGKRLQLANLEFYGGYYYLSHCAPTSFERSSFRYTFCRASSRPPPPFSSKAQVFPLSPAIIRCS